MNLKLNILNLLNMSISDKQYKYFKTAVAEYETKNGLTTTVTTTPTYYFKTSFFFLFVLSSVLFSEYYTQVENCEIILEQNKTIMFSLMQFKETVEHFVLETVENVQEYVNKNVDVDDVYNYVSDTVSHCAETSKQFSQETFEQLIMYVKEHLE